MMRRILFKLDRQLFMFDQTAGYMDHYEQGLYNHILASVAKRLTPSITRP